VVAEQVTGHLRRSGRSGSNDSKVVGDGSEHGPPDTRVERQNLSVTNKTE
jgi:hypothetical protein